MVFVANRGHIYCSIRVLPWQQYNFECRLGLASPPHESHAIYILLLLHAAYILAHNSQSSLTMA